MIQKLLRAQVTHNFIISVGLIEEVYLKSNETGVTIYFISYDKPHGFPFKVNPLSIMHFLIFLCHASVH